MIVYIILLVITIAAVILAYYLIKDRENITEPLTNAENKASILKNFEGLFEVLYKAANSKTPKKVLAMVLKDWNLRIDTYGDNNIKDSWKSYLIKYLPSNSLDEASNIEDSKLQALFQEWLKFIEKNGAVRDTRKKIKIERSTSQYYIFEEAYRIGDYATIDKPCWTYTDSSLVLEKGSASLL